MNYPNQSWREAEKVTDGTVGVGNPHKAGLVSNDGCYCGMLNDVTQKMSWCHVIGGPTFWSRFQAQRLLPLFI